MSSLGITSAPTDKWVYPSSEGSTPKASPRNTVFIGLFETPDGDSETDLTTEEQNRFLVEIRDEEFEEAIEYLIDKASELNTAEDPTEGLRQLENLFSKKEYGYANAGEIFYDHLIEQLGESSIESIEDSEIDHAIDSYDNQDPEMERFLGGLKKLTKKALKTASRAAKKGITIAGKLGLGPVIAQLKAIVKPLIQQVLKVAIEKLPPELQEPATQLAGKFGGEKRVPAKGPTDAVASDSSFIQSEFQQRYCAVLFSPEEEDQEYEIQDARRKAEAPVNDRLATIDRARARCISRLSKLQQHEDPEPVMEEFIVAILPALKLAISVIGRKKVISLLAKLIVPILRKLVTPQLAQPLSSAIASTGLGLMGLEMAQAITYTMEDVAQRLVRAPDYALVNSELQDELISEAAIPAFASHIKLHPDNLNGLLEFAAKHPDYLETNIGLGVWEMLPADGPRRYKRFNAIRPLRRMIRPHQLKSISTFGGASLAEAIEDQFDIEPGQEVEVEIQLYEVIPGTSIPECVRYEQLAGRIRKAFPALGALRQLHPLDEPAAELLTGEPGFGRLTPGAFNDPRCLVVGQRLFHIAPIAKKPTVAARAPGRTAVPCESSSIRLLIDFPGNVVRLQTYLSERKAQLLAEAYRPEAYRPEKRPNASVGQAIRALMRLISHRLDAIADGKTTAPLAIIHPILSPTEAVSRVRGSLPPARLKAFLLAIEAWAVNCATAQLSAQSQRLIEATKAPEDGVTLDFAIASVPGLDALSAALQGLPTKNATTSAFAGDPSVTLTIQSGRTFDW